MSKEVDRNKKAKGAVLIALLAGVLVIFVAGYLYNIYHEYREDQVSERIVEVPIGAYTFSFPRNAINNISTQKDNPRKSFVSLWFILPDMRPVTEQTRENISAYNRLTVNIDAEHYKSDSGTSINDKIDTSFKLDFKSKLDSRFNAKTLDGRGFVYPRIGQGTQRGDLILYERKENRAFSWDLYTNASYPVMFMLECDAEKPKFPNPMCSFNAEFLGHMSIHYRYPQKYLPQAIQIHQFVMSYLQSHFKGVTEHD